MKLSNKTKSTAAAVMSFSILAGGMIFEESPQINGQNITNKIFAPIINKNEQKIQDTYIADVAASIITNRRLEGGYDSLEKSSGGDYISLGISGWEGGREKSILEAGGVEQYLGRSWSSLSDDDKRIIREGISSPEAKKVQDQILRQNTQKYLSHHRSSTFVTDPKSLAYMTAWSTTSDNIVGRYTNRLQRQKVNINDVNILNFSFVNNNDSYAKAADVPINTYEGYKNRGNITVDALKNINFNTKELSSKNDINSNNLYSKVKSFFKDKLNNLPLKTIGKVGIATAGILALDPSTALAAVPGLDNISNISSDSMQAIGSFISSSSNVKRTGLIRSPAIRKFIHKAANLILASSILTMSMGTPLSNVHDAMMYHDMLTQKAAPVQISSGMSFYKYSERGHMDSMPEPGMYELKGSTVQDKVFGRAKDMLDLSARNAGNACIQDAIWLGATTNPFLKEMAEKDIQYVPTFLDEAQKAGIEIKTFKLKNSKDSMVDESYLKEAMSNIDKGDIIIYDGDIHSGYALDKNFVFQLTSAAEVGNIKKTVEHAPGEIDFIYDKLAPVTTIKDLKQYITSFNNRGLDSISIVKTSALREDAGLSELTTEDKPFEYDYYRYRQAMETGWVPGKIHGLPKELPFSGAFLLGTVGTKRRKRKNSSNASSTFNIELYDLDYVKNNIEDISKSSFGYSSNFEENTIDNINTDQNSIDTSQEIEEQNKERENVEIDNKYTDDIIESAIGNPKTKYKYQYVSPAGPSREGFDKSLAANSVIPDNEHIKAYEQREAEEYIKTKQKEIDEVNQAWGKYHEDCMGLDTDWSEEYKPPISIDNNISEEDIEYEYDYNYGDESGIEGKSLKSDDFGGETVYEKEITANTNNETVPDDIIPNEPEDLYTDEDAESLLNDKEQNNAKSMEEEISEDIASNKPVGEVEDNIEDYAEEVEDTVTEPNDKIIDEDTKTSEEEISTDVASGESVGDVKDNIEKQEEVIDEATSLDSDDNSKDDKESTKETSDEKVEDKPIIDTNTEEDTNKQEDTEDTENLEETLETDTTDVSDIDDEIIQDEEKELTPAQKQAKAKIEENSNLTEIASTPPPQETTADSIKEANKKKANRTKGMSTTGKIGSLIGLLMTADAAYTMISGGNKMPDQQYQNQPSFFS